MRNARSTSVAGTVTRARLREFEGNPGERALFATRLLEADPLDEDAVVALLSAQQALGQTTASVGAIALAPRG